MDLKDFPERAPSDPKERDEAMYLMLRRNLEIALSYEHLVRSAKLIMGTVAAVSGVIASLIALWGKLVEWIRH